jgi:hypothetical protein
MLRIDNFRPVFVCPTSMANPNHGAQYTGHLGGRAHSLRDNAAMPKAIRDNGLTLVLLLLFFISLAGQSFAGLPKYNEDEQEHGRPKVTYAGYLTSSAFVESVFEKWESEFLQMAFTSGSRAFSTREARQSPRIRTNGRRLMKNRRSIGVTPEPRVLSGRVGWC